MFLPITIPKGIALSDIRRLRSHATWYKSQIARHGPNYGSKRFARARQRRLTQCQNSVLISFA
jgi:hypothetical protein